MAAPLFLAAAAGAVVSALVTFVTSKLGMIIAGLGLTFVGVKGFEAFLGFVISDVIQIASIATTIGGTGAATGLGLKMVKLAAFAGLFDALNIVMAGYMAFASMMGLRFVLARLARGG